MNKVNHIYERLDSLSLISQKYLYSTILCTNNIVNFLMHSDLLNNRLSTQLTSEELTILKKAIYDLNKELRNE